MSLVSPESHLQPSSSSRRPPPNTPKLLSLAAACVRASRSPAAPCSRSLPAEQRPPHFAGVLLFFYLFRSAFLPHFLILFTEPQPEETAAHLHLYRKMYCIDEGERWGQKLQNNRGNFYILQNLKTQNTIPLTLPTAPPKRRAWLCST